MKQVVVIMLSVITASAVAAVPGLLVKFAARLGGIKVRWRHCFIFGLVVFLYALVLSSVVSVTKSKPPLVVGIIGGPAVYLFFGGWYFRSRGTNEVGAAIGTKGGLKLMLYFLVLLAAMTSIGLFIGRNRLLE